MKIKNTLIQTLSSVLEWGVMISSKEEPSNWVQMLDEPVYIHFLLLILRKTVVSYIDENKTVKLSIKMSIFTWVQYVYLIFWYNS